MSHTSGSWEMQEHPYDPAEIFGPRGELIATVLDDTAEGKANAQLILAAPELLRLAQEFLSALDSGSLVLSWGKQFGEHGPVDIEGFRAAVAEVERVQV